MSAIGGSTSSPGFGPPSLGSADHAMSRRSDGVFEQSFADWSIDEVRAFNRSVEVLRRERTSSDGQPSSRWVFGSQDGATIMARLTDGIADGTSILQLPRDFANRSDAMFPVQCWRRPTRSTCLLRNQFGESPQEVRFDPPTAAQARFDLHRFELDVWRDRLEDFVGPDSFTQNTHGMLERDDYPVLYRVDFQSPTEILAAAGFQADRQTQGIDSMIDRVPLIASCSLKASGVVLHMYAADDAQPRYRYQYAIKSDGITAASWLENFSYLQNKLPAIGGDRFDIGLDEVHVDASAISIERIFIIGSDDPFVMQHLVECYVSQQARTVFGVSVEEFCTSYGVNSSPIPVLPRFPAGDCAPLDAAPKTTDESSRGVNSTAEARLPLESEPASRHGWPRSRLIGSHLSIDSPSDESRSGLFRWCNWLCA